jgi:hypothetical protein
LIDYLLTVNVNDCDEFKMLRWTLLTELAVSDVGKEIKKGGGGAEL